MTSLLTWHCQSNTHYFTDTIYLRLPLSRPQRKPGCFRVSETIRVCTLQSYTHLSNTCVIVSEQPRWYIYLVKPKFPYTSIKESTRNIRRTQKVPTDTWGLLVGPTIAFWSSTANRFFQSEKPYRLPQVSIASTDEAIQILTLK